MRSTAALGVVLALASGSNAQQSAYGQYYSQCIPGTGSMTQTTQTILTTSVQSTSSSSTQLTSTRSTTSAAPTGTSALECTGTFTPISASEYVAAMNPGWNLGNTLDATPDEGSWNNPPVVAETFADVKAAGFKSVLTSSGDVVTYADHFTGSSPDWTIDPDWLQRVSDVVDMAVDAGLYVLTNVHHDSWEWADVSASGANLTMIEEKMHRTWVQIGETLGCKSSMVSLEPINEPPASDAEDGTELNKINGIFLQALAESGGFNTQRVVTLVGGAMDSIKTSEWFVAPTGYDNPWALQYHYYSPYDFIFSAWGKTILTDSDIATIEADLANIRGNFTDVPLLIGEFDASPINCEPAARRKYMDVVARTAKELDTAVILWDNGLDHLDRDTHTWRDVHAIQILMNAVAGVSNSLSDATTDAAATEQSSSAYLFHKVGDAVADQAITVSLNGNTLDSIATDDGMTLTAPTDYSISDETITFTSSFLSQYVSETAEPGTKVDLTLTFSAGATAGVTVAQWELPTLASTSSTAVAGADLLIPITWGGINEPAAVKMLRSDGDYLFDDWTQYLGPLQAAYGTYSGQWNWDSGDLILTSTTVAAVIAARVPTTFTFDFFPRVAGNSLNYTLNV
ncbi:Uu.00g147190.m01.CDS01 [Anthostomella pinea]|uniref:Uu.00g147190.m01.CDS01 n=1 Tax=Anthostomella pinea TaxID=933095 RepID=A0AAI8YLW9_9PEZI|nr:Uu.00g147190.m01.CDS01 [Anthostomella pinea]